MPQLEHQKTVIKLPENVRALDSLKELFWHELNCHRVDERCSWRQWTDRYARRADRAAGTPQVYLNSTPNLSHKR